MRRAGRRTAGPRSNVELVPGRDRRRGGGWSTRAAWRGTLGALLAACLASGLAACGSGGPEERVHTAPAGSIAARTTATPRSESGVSAAVQRPSAPGAAPLARPADLTPFRPGAAAREGVWHEAGRPVAGVPAVYETLLTAPGGSQPSGIAWMDTNLLSARLYSGSKSPGGGPYRYTAPIEPAAARRLVAAFNGGFMMDAARGGYYTERRMIRPLRAGAASLVIYADGSVDLGAWGSQVTMTPRVAAVRQNLVPLVDGGRPTPRARSADWQAWGSTCGAYSCAASVPGIERQWRSGLGVSSDGALVYVQGPALDPLQLAMLLARAGSVRGMELDINPDWPLFASYRPAGEHGLATPADGHALLAGTVRGPGTFFEASWARDFVTLSARPPTG